MSMRTLSISHAARFWRGMPRPVGAGAWLRPDPAVDASPYGQAVEMLLEQLRPAAALPRTASLFAVETATSRLGDTCGFDADAANFYEIAPIGTVYRNDGAWLRMLQDAGARLRLIQSAEADRIVRAYAHAYWSGAPSPQPRWECRMAAAQVIAPVRELGQGVAADDDRIEPIMGMTC